MKIVTLDKEEASDETNTNHTAIKAKLIRYYKRYKIIWCKSIILYRVFSLKNKK